MRNTAHRKPSPSPWWQKKVSGGGVRGTEDTSQGHWAKSLLASSVCPSINLYKKLQSKQRQYLSLQIATLRRLGEWQEAPRLTAGNYWDKTVTQYKVNTLKRDSTQVVPSQRILEEAHLVTSWCQKLLADAGRKQPSNRVMGTVDKRAACTSLGWADGRLWGGCSLWNLGKGPEPWHAETWMKKSFPTPRTQSLSRGTQGPTEKEIPWTHLPPSSWSPAVSSRDIRRYPHWLRKQSKKDGRVWRANRHIT